MAGRLQGREEELRRTRAAEADAEARFGEALERTHDLDGLLQTVLEAACVAVTAAAGAALVGNERTLEERGAVNVGDVPVPARASASLGRLARRALTDGRPVVAGPAEAGAPVLAVPLRAADRVLGALAVARPAGEPRFGPEDTEALQDLARHAGAAVANALAHEETRRLSVTDPLTGAGNFRQLSTTLAREVERATRFNRPLSVVMLDLDHFKVVNDTHGHPFGDGVLREFARRPAGLPARGRHRHPVRRRGVHGRAARDGRRRRGGCGGPHRPRRQGPALRGRQPQRRGHRVGRRGGVPRPRPDRERDPAGRRRRPLRRQGRGEGPLVPRRGLAERLLPGGPGDHPLDETLDETLEGPVQGVGAARPGRGG